MFLKLQQRHIPMQSSDTNQCIINNNKTGVRLNFKAYFNQTLLIRPQLTQNTGKWRSLVWILMPTTFHPAYSEHLQRLWSSDNTEIRSLTTNNSHSDLFIFFYYKQQMTIIQSSQSVSQYKLVPCEGFHVDVPFVAAMAWSPMNKASIVEAVLQRLIALGRVANNRYINYLLYFFIARDDVRTQRDQIPFFDDE